MAITLYHCHESRSMRSLWLLYELGLEPNVITLNFGESLRSDEYMARHPLGRVPCLEEDDLRLFESGAITEYLCEKYDEGTLWRTPGHPERPEWLQWLHYAETITCHIANLTQQLIAIVDPALRSATVRKLETRRLEKTLGVLEQQLQDRDYLLKSGFSAVDIGIGYSLYSAGKFTDLRAFPNVHAYYERLAQRPAFQQALPLKGADNLLYKERNYWLES